ncbi:hypothetical protein L1887_20276 [Cichorium endivia]|nr:hypothetical protein L1887_20276 [Cichorium endivia]
MLPQAPAAKTQTRPPTPSGEGLFSGYTSILDVVSASHWRSQFKPISPLHLGSTTARHHDFDYCPAISITHLFLSENPLLPAPCQPTLAWELDIGSGYKHSRLNRCHDATAIYHASTLTLVGKHGPRVRFSHHFADFEKREKILGLARTIARTPQIIA